MNIVFWKGQGTLSESVIFMPVNAFTSKKKEIEMPANIGSSNKIELSYGPQITIFKNNGKGKESN